MTCYLEVEKVNDARWGVSNVKLFNARREEFITIPVRTSEVHAEFKAEPDWVASFPEGVYPAWGEDITNLGLEWGIESSCISSDGAAWPSRIYLAREPVAPVTIPGGLTEISDILDAYRKAGKNK